MANLLGTITLSSTLALFLGCTSSSDNAGADGGGADANRQGPPDAALMDAHPAMLNCGNGAVPDPLALSGKVEDLIGSSAAKGVVLDVYPSGSADPIATVTTSPDGEYTLDIPTGESMWTGEIRATHEDYIPMHIYPSGLVENFDALDIPALTPEARNLASLYAGVEIGENDALVIGFIFDCNQDGIEGASITTDLESGDLLYLVDGAPYIDTAQTTTSTSGTAMVLNAVANSATPGKAKLNASYQDRTWEVTVDVIPGELAVAIFLP